MQGVDIVGLEKQNNNTLIMFVLFLCNNVLRDQISSINC